MSQTKANDGRNVYFGVSLRGKTNNKQEFIVCRLIIGTMKKDKAERERGERACDMNVGCSFY